MKSILKLLFITCLILGINSPKVNAAEFKIGAEITITAGYSEHVYPNSNNIWSGDEYVHRGWQERIQTSFTWLASDYAFATFMTRTPAEMAWGNDSNNDNGSLLNKNAKTGVPFTLKLAFLDFKVPETEARVRLGLQYYRLPGYLGFITSPVQAEYIFGARVTSPVAEKHTFEFMWLRPSIQKKTEYIYDDYTMAPYPGFGAGQSFTYIDDFQQTWTGFDGFAASFTYRSDLVNATPWAMIAHLDGDTILSWSGFYNAYYYTLGRSSATIYWLGLTNQFKFDKLSFGLEGAYSGHDGNQRNDGWFIDAYARYQLESFKPGIVVWYANGNTKNRVAGLICVADGNWTAGYTNFFNFHFANNQPGSGGNQPAGTTGFTLESGDYKPFEKWTFNLTFLGVMGTNHPDYSEAVDSSGNPIPYALTDMNTEYLTTKDYALNAMLMTRYNISQKLYFWWQAGVLHTHFGRDGAENRKNLGYALQFTTVYTF